MSKSAALAYSCARMQYVKENIVATMGLHDKEWTDGDQEQPQFDKLPESMEEKQTRLLGILARNVKNLCALQEAKYTHQKVLSEGLQAYLCISNVSHTPLSQSFCQLHEAYKKICDFLSANGKISLCHRSLLEDREFFRVCFEPVCCDCSKSSFPLMNAKQKKLQNVVGLSSGLKGSKLSFSSLRSGFITTIVLAAACSSCGGSDSSNQFDSVTVSCSPELQDYEGAGSLLILDPVKFVRSVVWPNVEYLVK